jgi:hypothetical protein
MSVAAIERKADLYDAQRELERAAGRLGLARRYAWDEVRRAAVQAEFDAAKARLASLKALN